MAEYYVGPVIDRIIGDFYEYLKDTAGWKTGVKKELKKLRAIHLQIQAVVSAYNQVEIEDPALNKWLWKLRDAIDEADDVLEEFRLWRYEGVKISAIQRSAKLDEADDVLWRKEELSRIDIQRSEQMANEGMAARFARALGISKSAIQNHPMTNLEEAIHKLYEISAEVSTFRHLLKNTKEKQQQQQLQLYLNRETGSLPANVLLGRSKEMEFVSQWLRNPHPIETTNSDLYRNISLLSVVGLGGMGKTTLLQHVFKDLTLNKDGMTEGFDIKMWVCVSTDFDAIMVIKNILESLKKERPNLETLAALQSSLQSEVMSKRFLIVLDDIWEGDETKWGNVFAPLQYGSSGSKIFITTRMNSVASNFAKMIKNNQTLQLKGLEKDDCLQLFNRYAFDGVENRDDKLSSITLKMVENLSGCPLVAKVIGKVLNDYMDVGYWKNILNTDIRNIESEEDRLLPILKLSYIYLPNFLKNCFAFCCIFPQDYQFDKDDLVRMWIALGFVENSDIQGETRLDKGRRYFNILVEKSFLDEFRTYDDKVCYKMHDLLHQLAQSVYTKESLKVVDDKEFSFFPETIRHLSITSHSGSLEAIFQKMRKLKILRSLFLSFSNVEKLEENAISQILKVSKSIRLLVIHPPIDNYTLPETIDCLIHLRYLKVESLELKLPRSIYCLHNLRFIISKSLQISEMCMFSLDYCMPLLIMDELVIKDPFVLRREPMRSRSSFTSLRIEKNDELDSFPAATTTTSSDPTTSQDESFSIEKWFLQHSSSLFNLSFNNLRYLRSLPFFLESLSSLKTLYLSDVPQLEELPNLPASLTTLYLHNLESLRCLPSSLSTNSSLNFLELMNIPHLRSLSDLPPSLMYLNLVELENLDCLPHCLPPLLKTLDIRKVFRLKELPDLPSSLERLDIGELELLQFLPSCLLTSLNTLTINKVPRLSELPHLPSSLEELYLRELRSLLCLPSCLHTLLRTLDIRNVPKLKKLPDLPSSLKRLYFEELELLCHLPSSCLPTLLEKLDIRKLFRLEELPDLPSSLKSLDLEGLESLCRLPSCLPTSLNTLTINKVPWLLKLPDLPSSLVELNLGELRSLQWMPSCLPPLEALSIIKVPRLQELPELPASLKLLKIEDCDSDLMERYLNFDRR